jgi:Ca-activated chloride channel family protein
LTANGTGPGLSGDQYTRIIENPFIKAEGGAAVSTFSIDVDTASYANVRQFLLEMNQLPPLDAVRIEELVNYFDYNYAGPNSDDESPFAAHVEVAGCPWTPDHRLVRIGIKGRELDRNKRPKSNLVFLVDVSGSMDEPNKLPLVVYGLQQLTRELGENDRVAIVVYASSEGLVLPSTPGSKQDVILDALGKLSAGGSTAGGAGIQLAYQIAEDNFIEGGTNRVILCTDGDFNVGVTSTAELERLCEEKAKGTRVFLSVLGFGRGNLNDTMMQAISNRGNGNHYYVDGRSEARRVLVEEMTGTLITIAKDVKIQVEFNPRKVAGYRLIGYENRMLRTEDFNDDKKDAGEIGAGHTVTALYEVVPAGKPVEVAPVDDLKYQQPATEIGDDAEIGGELLTLKMRYKTPEGDTSKKLEWPVTDDGKAFSAASEDCQFASAVAGFGMLLRNSQHKGNLTYAAALELAQSALGEDEHGYRSEFLDMLRKAKSLKGE